MKKKGWMGCTNCFSWDKNIVHFLHTSCPSQSRQPIYLYSTYLIGMSHISHTHPKCFILVSCASLFPSYYSISIQLITSSLPCYRLVPIPSRLASYSSAVPSTFRANSFGRYKFGGFSIFQERDKCSVYSPNFKAIRKSLMKLRTNSLKLVVSGRREDLETCFCQLLSTPDRVKQLWCSRCSRVSTAPVQTDFYIVLSKTVITYVQTLHVKKEK